MRQIFFLVLINFICKSSLACSFAPGYSEPRISSAFKVDYAPTKPLVTIDSIQRGHDDGNGGSCSDAGIIVLRFQDDNLLSQTSYKLEVLSNETFPDIFPSFPVTFSPTGMHNREMRFVWYDLGVTKGKEIDIRLKVTAVSHSGNESEPYELAIYSMPE